MLLGRLLRDQRGRVAPMFALALIPLAAAVGSGVDYAIAAKIRIQLLAAADAASIASVSKTSLPTNAWYMKWIAPFADQIGKNMQNCASSGLYFEVSPTQGISEAMNALFQKAVAQNAPHQVSRRTRLTK